MKQDTRKQLQTFAGLLIAALLVAVAMPVLQLVLGFTNPSEDPPGGGGILQEDDGDLSISSVRLTDLAAPVDDNDGANKAYVDAQVGSGGSIVTLFGVATPAPTGSNVRAGGSVPSCLRGIGPGSCATAPSAPVSAGTGTPACSTLGSGWTELVAGYGPMNTLFAWYTTAGSNPDETDVPDMAVIGNDSICSTAPYALVRDINFDSQGGQVNNSGSVLSACTTTQCNTCRICSK